MAFLIEQAGGVATTGTQRILDIVPTGIHQRIPVFLGSKDETVGDIRKSLKGLPADIDTLVAVANAENRDRVINRLDLISVELALIDVRLGEFRMESDKITAHLNSEVAADRAHLSAARDRVAGISVDPANSSLVSGP